VRNCTTCVSVQVNLHVLKKNWFHVTEKLWLQQKAHNLKAAFNKPQQMQIVGVFCCLKYFHHGRFWFNIKA